MVHRLNKNGFCKLINRIVLTGMGFHDDLYFQYVTGKARDNMILESLNEIDGLREQVTDQHRKETWDRYWHEVYADFEYCKFQDAHALVPKYLYDVRPLRLFGEWIEPLQQDFLVKVHGLIRDYLAWSHFSEVPRIVEFGCGSGFNLVALSRLFEHRKGLLGLDRSGMARRCAATAGQAFKLPMEVYPFDITDPDYRVNLQTNGVLTSGALEQTGIQWKPFLKYLLEKKPSVVVHIEPFLEWYDAESMMDHLAAKYHMQRGYLRGFIPALRELQGEGKIEILSGQRVQLGGPFNDGFSFIVWRPV